MSSIKRQILTGSVKGLFIASIFLGGMYYDHFYFKDYKKKEVVRVQVINNTPGDILGISSYLVNDLNEQEAGAILGLYYCAKEMGIGHQFALHASRFFKQFKDT